MFQVQDNLKPFYLSLIEYFSSLLERNLEAEFRKWAAFRKRQIKSPWTKSILLVLFNKLNCSKTCLLSWKYYKSHKMILSAQILTRYSFWTYNIIIYRSEKIMLRKLMKIFLSIHPAFLIKRVPIHKCFCSPELCLFLCPSNSNSKFIWLSRGFS